MRLEPIERRTVSRPLGGRRAGLGRVEVLGLSIWKIAIIGAIVLVLFGKGKVSEMMGDVAKGIKSFKKGMAEDDDSPKTIDAKAGEASQTAEKAGG